ncbi:LamG-like jellyroll fold domain-containing protein [Lacinutrix gracilariae]|uniref:LamG-like jellyroll fold domain-containing protein n=1 Tax=Lacinutrix gracilariae TaxID=1747198 RepID=A0ABW5K4R8_9FLAO
MKNKLLLVIVLFATQFISAQTCNGITFNSPGAPTTSTYTYTASGWYNFLGLPTFAPTHIQSSQSVRILADNSSDDFGNIKGTFYVAPGVTYSGNVNSLNSGTLIVEGNVTFNNAPTASSTTIYVHDTGVLNFSGSLLPGGFTESHNTGIINVGGAFAIGGNVVFYNYSDSKMIIQGDTHIANDFYNCGLLEVEGDFSGGGTSGLVNSCTTYIHENFDINATFTNDGLLVIDGSIDFDVHDFVNNFILIVNNIYLNNNDLIGNNETSMLIVRNQAELISGASITGHYYYDVDDGGGFDVACPSCTEQVDTLIDVDIPVLIDELVEDCGASLVPESPEPIATLDFDGVDDYLSTNAFLDGLSEVTIMAWVKIDPTSAGTSYATIAGEDVSCRLYVQNGNKLVFGTRTTAGTTNIVNGINVAYNEWHHVTGTFSATTGMQTVYVDGEKSDSKYLTSQIGQVIQASASSNGAFEIGRFSNNASDKQYFNGEIDEVRVFDSALTEDQIQRMVYQEIKNESGKVRGTVIPKDIVDISSGNTVSWNSLLAYYPMTDIISFKRTKDYSLNNRYTTLNNITSIQEQTAPMPYETVSNGDWASESTWLHGNVWDIEDVANNKDWSIVYIKNNVDAAHAVKNIGLFVDTNKTFTVNGDNQVNNSWYLELDGALDLKEDSQLIQGVNSDLVTSANGKILRRQEGASSYYWYNYWASPVGQTGVTSLSDNNAAANNTNNTSFSINMLKKGDGSAIQFISGNHQTDRLSTRWMYTYQNGVTYYDWGSVNQTTAINPGVGYIHKGMGVGTEQQYLFEGKPNNGTIKLSVADVGGEGSGPGVSKTEYLLGNPYASAIDIYKFLEDNASVLEGSIQLWQQWDGVSHVTSEYEGGYAQVNKTGSVRAYQFEGGTGGHNGSLDGTKLPTKYLPVGQGFMAEIKNNGTVVFKNSQRVFVKEADADGTETNGSAFFRSTDQVSYGPSMQKLRLEFNALDGQATRRELLLGFSNITTDAYDYGYEAKNTDNNHDDLNLMLDGEYMTIQSYAEITDDKVVPLALKTSGNNSYSIKLTETINMAEDQEVYLRDNLANVYYNLRQDTAYTFTSTAGVFNDRFEIVFSSQTLSTEEVAVNNNTVIYYNNNSSLLYVKGLQTEGSKVNVTNMLGQNVFAKTNVSNTTLENGLPIHTLATGIYIVSIKTEDHQTIEKKIVVE